MTVILVYVIAKCDPVWQKGTYSLSNCVTLWAHSFKSLHGISLKFLQAILLCYWSRVTKKHWHRLSRNQVTSAQSRKSGKAISPFLSDRVTNLNHDNSGEFCADFCWILIYRFPLIVVIRIFAIKLPSQPFLDCHLEFHRVRIFAWSLLTITNFSTIVDT